jgi:hypothetical protein
VEVIVRIKLLKSVSYIFLNCTTLRSVERNGQPANRSAEIPGPISSNLV